ncbi:large conductance mechanosensitive channel protein MscL [bacterium]|nr:large conductance mechanosensitive channel protein MscL [bacterium]
MFKEFKEFAMRGPVLDLAIAVVLGAAFGAIIASLVADVIMPPIGLLLGNVDFANLFTVLKQGTEPGPYASLADAQAAGAVTINYGIFIMKIISFIIIALVIFIIIRNINKLKRKEEAPPEEPTTKECPHCFTEISIKATRCPNCTSQLS